MSISLTNMTLHARLLLQDTSTASPALTDAQYLILLNEKYAWLKEEVDPRATWVNHTTLFGAAGIAAKAAMTTATNYRKFLSLLPESGATTQLFAGALERVEPNELADFATSATYALSRQQLGATAADSGKWTVHFAKAPSTEFFSAWVIKEVTALSAGADLPELSDHECYIVSRAAAVEAARLAGRTEMIPAIMAPLPKYVQDALATSMNIKKPRSRTMDDAF